MITVLRFLIEGGSSQMITVDYIGWNSPLFYHTVILSHFRCLALPVICLLALLFISFIVSQHCRFLATLFFSFLFSFLNCFPASLFPYLIVTLVIKHLLQGVPALHTNTDILKHSDSFPHLCKDPEQVLQEEKKL